MTTANFPQVPSVEEVCPRGKLQEPNHSFVFHKGQYEIIS